MNELRPHMSTLSEMKQFVDSLHPSPSGRQDTYLRDNRAPVYARGGNLLKKGGYGRHDKSDKGSEYYDVVNMHYRGVMNELRNRGLSFKDAQRLAPILVTQLTREGGWTDTRPDNNFGGLRTNNGTVQMEFASPQDFYEQYIDLLDARWGASRGENFDWRNSISLEDYARRVNREDLGLHTKQQYDAYNRQHPDNPVFLYTPEWNNSNRPLRHILGDTQARTNQYLKMVYEEDPVENWDVVQRKTTQPPKKSGYYTHLRDSQEKEFQKWYGVYAKINGIDPNPNDPRHAYDYRGLYKSLVDWQRNAYLENPGVHLPDTYKWPTHETFSVESKYYKPRRMKDVGHWEGENFIEGQYNRDIRNNEAFNLSPQQVLDMIEANRKAYGGPVRKFGDGSKKDGTLTDADIQEGTDERAVYARRLIQFATKNPTALWKDTPEAAKARAWLRKNAPDQLTSIYHSLDADAKKGIDRRFIPEDAKVHDFQQKIRDYRDNEGVKLVAGSAAVPLSIMGGVEAVQAVPGALSWLSKLENIGKVVRTGADIGLFEGIDRAPAWITDDPNNRLNLLGGRGLEAAYRWMMPESRFTESSAPYVNGLGRLATMIPEGVVADRLMMGSADLVYNINKARRIAKDPYLQAKEAMKKMPDSYFSGTDPETGNLIGFNWKTHQPLVYKDGAWGPDFDAIIGKAKYYKDATAQNLEKRMEQSAEKAKKSISDSAMAIKDNLTAQNLKNMEEMGKDIRVSFGVMPEDPKEQMEFILEQAKTGRRAPLQTKVTDMFGREVEIPEEFAAAMQTPHFQEVYPEGVDFWWRGFDPNGLADKTAWHKAPTEYPSIFGGEYDMARHYTAGFSGAVPEEKLALSTQEDIPNLMLMMTPKGGFRPLGSFEGGHWRHLPNIHEQDVVNAQKELTAMFEAAAKDPNYVWDHAKKDQLQYLIQSNPLKIPELRDGTFMSTDDIAAALKYLPKSEQFKESGVWLRDVQDGYRGSEVIWNPERGGYPKVVSPNSSFKFDLLDPTYLERGGHIHIKPENRGKFTELKRRTGHSASWFKEHGTPAQKKMAVFALNAKKWKH